MGEPTLKDVLAAIADLRAETKADLAKLDAKVDAHRAEARADIVGVRSDLAGLRSDVDAHRAETRTGFRDLDQELTGHAATHREIEKDIEDLKRRAPRTAARAPRSPRTR